MPRVNSVKHARKSPGTCCKCSTKIKKREPYLWWKFRFGGKYIRCSKPECYPRASDLTQSAFWGAIGDLQAREFAACEDSDALESERDDIISELESLRDEQEEKRGNMPDALQESDTGNLLQERYDALDEAVNELQSADCSIDIEDEPEKNPKESDKKFDSRHEEWEQDRQEKLDAVREQIVSALENISCS